MCTQLKKKDDSDKIHSKPWLVLFKLAKWTILINRASFGQHFHYQQFYIELKALQANNEGPDQTPQFEASDLGLYLFVFVFPIWDTRLIL